MTDNLTTGSPDVSPDLPSHIDGISQGNATGRYEKQAGHKPDGRATPERSTGVNADARKPVHPAMPVLTPH
ncbi:MAG: hypothetical protein ACR2NA_07850 [Solirubrobacterales bacterium]